MFKEDPRAIVLNTGTSLTDSNSAVYIYKYHKDLPIDVLNQTKKTNKLNNSYAQVDCSYDILTPEEI